VSPFLPLFVKKIVNIICTIAHTFRLKGLLYIHTLCICVSNYFYFIKLGPYPNGVVVF